MASYEKVVKLACKPKAAAPKSKYIDPIIAATYSDDGAVSDVCRALAPRFKEPNVIVVFKALIVLHTMMRNGSTDNVLSFLASSDVLRLQNVSNGNWEGYQPPQNLANYASYLDSRVKAYKELKHDAIRVQTESNRDHRVSVLEDDVQPHRSAGVQRSKTIAGRKLRIMSVEKGLLRETKIVQRMIDTLIDTKFYLDDLEDELNITALRMIVKDLLVLFQAGNEGVINLLEHYFEMSHIDAENALGLYRKFCRQTVKVVDYLSVAKKLQNLLNVSIPNLKHAPVSLVGALEEYLQDPNFEQNRLEYKANKDAADGKTPARTVKPSNPPPAAQPAPAASSSSSAPTQKTDQNIVDFFSSIEQEQSSMFNPNSNSPTSNYFQQQATFNPFAQQQSALSPQMTGAAFFGAGGPQPQQGPFVQTQPTGFMQPQNTAFGPAPSNSPFFQQQQPPQLNGFSQPPQQLPQQASFLQPQATGANPFRQSILMPQNTGFGAFGGGAPPQGPTGHVHFGSSGSNPFPRAGSAIGLQSQPTGSPFGVGNTNNGFSPNNAFASQNQGQMKQGGPGILRPASTPITSQPSISQTLAPVKTHQTGSRNPFGRPNSPPPPPVPKGPTLFELANPAFSQFNNPNTNGQAPPPQSSPSQSGAQLNPTFTGGGGLLSSVASSFATGGNSSSSGSTTTGTPAPASSATGGSAWPLSAQTTSSTSNWSDSFSNFSSSGRSAATTNATSPSTAPLQSQPTGFGGSTVKPFKPSSSFGATLLESLPTIPSQPSTPAAQPQQLQPSGLTTQPTGFGALNAQPTGFTPSSAFGTSAFGNGSSGGVVGSRPLQAQYTGVANPFRASMAGGGLGPSFSGASPVAGGGNRVPSFGTSLFPTSSGQNSAGSNAFGNAFGGQQPQSQFGGHNFSGAFGGGSSTTAPSAPQQQQQYASQSLI